MATIHQQVWIDASPQRVFEALATAEGLGRWWAPHASEDTEAGPVLSHSPGPEHGDVRMKVLERTPHERVAWEIVSHHPPRSPASAWTGTRITFDIAQRPSPGPWMGRDDEGRPLTVVEFRHAGWDEDSEFLGFCTYAWAMTLNLLKEFCETP